MTTTINKSQVMKRAWNIYRGNNPYSYSFSASLRRAWEVEKANIRYEAEQAEKAANKARMEAAYQRSLTMPSIEKSEAYNLGAAAYYANARPGTYFGD